MIYLRLFFQLVFISKKTLVIVFYQYKKIGLTSFPKRQRNLWQKCMTLGTFKGSLLGLRQFLANETLLKMMKKAFYFTLKALFILKIFKFLS